MLLGNIRRLYGSIFIDYEDAVAPRRSGRRRLLFMNSAVFDLTTAHRNSRGIIEMLPGYLWPIYLTSCSYEYWPSMTQEPQGPGSAMHRAIGDSTFQGWYMRHFNSQVSKSVQHIVTGRDIFSFTHATTNKLHIHQNIASLAHDLPDEYTLYSNIRIVPTYTCPEYDSIYKAQFQKFPLLREHSWYTTRPVAYNRAYSVAHIRARVAYDKYFARRHIDNAVSSTLADDSRTSSETIISLKHQATKVFAPGMIYTSTTDMLPYCMLSRSPRIVRRYLAIFKAGVLRAQSMYSTAVGYAAHLNARRIIRRVIARIATSSVHWPAAAHLCAVRKSRADAIVEAAAEAAAAAVESQKKEDKLNEYRAEKKRAKDDKYAILHAYDYTLFDPAERGGKLSQLCSRLHPNQHPTPAPARRSMNPFLNHLLQQAAQQV